MSEPERSTATDAQRSIAVSVHGLRYQVTDVLRNQMEVGPGGRQVQIEDPDGNLFELFEPAR